MSGYCTAADVVPFLPSGGLPNPARTCTGNAGSDYFESDGHGLADDDEVRFRVETGGTMPTGLTAGTTYYAIVVSPSRFQVAATAGGAAINFTTAGTTVLFMVDLPMTAWIEWGARQVDSFLPAHVVPIVAPYPEIVVQANAELAATLGLAKTGGADIDLTARIDAVGARLTRWAKAIPLRGDARSTQSPVNLAVTSSTGASDPRGWVSRSSSGDEVIP